MNLIKEGVQLFPGIQGHIVAAVKRVKAFPGGGSQPFDPGPVFPFTLLQKPETFAHHFAGVAEATGSDAGLDELVKMFCQVDLRTGIGEPLISGLPDPI